MWIRIGKGLFEQATIAAGEYFPTFIQQINRINVVGRILLQKTAQGLRRRGVADLLD